MVILSIKFKNFYSFKEESKMDFIVNNNAPATNHLHPYQNGHYSKISSIFGANASGKSNVIRAFEFLREFISESFSYSPKGFSGFYPFKTTKGEPAHFEVEFCIENIFYKLILEINSERVLSETLQSRRDTRLTTLYSRKYINNEYQFSGKNIDLEDSFIEKVRPNASIISTAKQYNHLELSKIKEAWFNMYIIIKPFDDLGFFEPMFSTSEFYSKNKKYFSQTKNFLKKADLGLLDIELEQKERNSLRKGKETLHFPYGVHKNKNKKFKLSFPMESGGTWHLYDMLRFIFPALEEGSVCLIDEIEANLHPNILPVIFDLFADKDTNPKGAQLICTTHMSTLMKDLSKYQIFLVEKNKDCESEVYRLDDVDGVRNDDNLIKKYLAGAYGGVPDVDITYE